jgi:molybdopterin-containing oxidoreductase family iron-sulfur binding subunit
MKKARRYGMVIDVDRCTGCGACMVACAVENNVPPPSPGETPRTALTPLRVYPVRSEGRTRFLPVMCMQCGEYTPCETVCPQQAVEVDKATGIVHQMPQRCLGCRYCMAACPYHARYFNWSDPEWPKGMEKTLNPAVSPRMRGVVEKCNFCHGRLHAAEDRAVATGAKTVEYMPACAEACPTSAIVFGDLDDAASAAAIASKDAKSFRLLARLGTEPKVHYHSDLPWVRALSERGGAAPKEEEVTRG